jgi:hypothetical protein
MQGITPAVHGLQPLLLTLHRQRVYVLLLC